MIFQIVSLDTSHERNTFDCGVPELNDFLKTKARQNQDKGMNRTFVAICQEDLPKKILGFYCISSGQVNLEMLPETLRKRLPRHPVPIARIGRLAVDLAARGQRLGELLLVDALKRIENLSSQIGIFAVVVDAKNKNAVNFYLKYGFTHFKNENKVLFLPIKSIIIIDDQFWDDQFWR
jgi:ribosomal protein S18 acetylase RimI-like enzyme